MTLTALYEWFAQDCAQAAGQTEDPKNREMLLKLAEQWLLDARRSAAENRRCCRRRGARLSASVRDPGPLRAKTCICRALPRKRASNVGGTVRPRGGSDVVAIRTWSTPVPEGKPVLPLRIRSM